jgi:hypothetical protein
VCVQFKHRQKLPPQESEKAIRTTDPSQFLSVKKQGIDSPTCSNPAMRDKLVEAIKNLGNGTEKAGPDGLLRVVISHPSSPNRDKLKNAAESSVHPIATVPLDRLFDTGSDLSKVIGSLAKRKAESDMNGPSRKKRKVD